MQIWASYTFPLEEDTDEQAAHHKEIKYKHPFNGHMQWNLIPLADCGNVSEMNPF